MEYPEPPKKRPRKKTTSEDLPGSGAARRAGDAIESRKSRSRSVLSEATAAANVIRDSGEQGGD